MQKSAREQGRNCCKITPLLMRRLLQNIKFILLDYLKLNEFAFFTKLCVLFHLVFYERSSI